MNTHICIIMLALILVSFNAEGGYKKSSLVNYCENVITKNIQDSSLIPETKNIQDENNDTVNKESLNKTDEYLSNFVDKHYNPYFHPPSAASGYSMEDMVIDKINDGKVTGSISGIAGFKGFDGVFIDSPIDDENSIIVITTWAGRDPITDDEYPEAYTKTKIIFDRVIDGNPVIKTIELGPIEGSEAILEEYYFNSEPGTISEWFSNYYMYYDLHMTEEEMSDWLTENINTPWK